MITFGGSASAGASVNTNTFLSDEVEILGANVGAVCWIAGGCTDYKK